MPENNHSLAGKGALAPVNIVTIFILGGTSKLTIEMVARIRKGNLIVVHMGVQAIDDNRVRQLGRHRLSNDRLILVADNIALPVVDGHDVLNNALIFIVYWNCDLKLAPECSFTIQNDKISAILTNLVANKAKSIASMATLRRALGIGLASSEENCSQSAAEFRKELHAVLVGIAQEGERVRPIIKEWESRGDSDQALRFIYSKSRALKRQHPKDQNLRLSQS